MAMRSAISRASGSAGIGARSSSRWFSDGKKVLSEEEKAAENVYIKKMERERMEKMKLKEEKEKAAAEKEKAGKKSDESHKG